MIRVFALVAGWLATAMPAAAVIDITEVETPGGLEAWLVEDPSIPFVSIEIAFRGGTSVDPEGRRGAVNLMTGLLEEGAGTRDARAFAVARDDLAAGFSFSASDDAVTISARFLTESADAAIDLLADALARPRFDPQAVERVRAQVLSGLRSDTEDPQAIAGRVLARNLYGEDHPYATPGEGTLDSVAALDRDDLRAAHAAALARDRVVIGAAGDITPERLAELLDRLLADLPQTGAPLPGPAETRFPGGVQVEPFPTPQSVIRFYQPGVDRHDPDFFEAFVLNQILGGGGFTARLMEEVREKRGLTYGIYSYLSTKDHADIWTGAASTLNARAGETVEVTRAQWARMAEDGPTAEELEAAKTYLIGGYPLRFDGNGTIAGILAGMQLDGLPVSYVDTRNARIAEITLEDVRRVARERLDPERLTFLVVGQPEGVSDAQ